MFVRYTLDISEVKIVMLLVFLCKWLIFKESKWIDGKSTILRAEMENHHYGDGDELSYVSFSDDLVLAWILI